MVGYVVDFEPHGFEFRGLKPSPRFSPGLRVSAPARPGSLLRADALVAHLLALALALSLLMCGVPSYRRNPHPILTLLLC